MTILLKILLSFVLLFLLSCSSKSKNTSPLIPKDTTNENERKNSLFVFVGEKINVEDLQEQNSMDMGIKAQYKILQRIYGDYPADTIEFKAYDHREYPPFTKFKNVLLFVVGDSGGYFQEKYQYFDVYKTKNGRWAGAYSRDEYGYAKTYYNGTSIKPEKIDFLEEVAYPVTSKTDTTDSNEYLYPAPYYKKVSGKAIAIYGNYTEDLFLLKKEGILNMRGLFGDKSPDHITIVDTKMAEVAEPIHDARFKKFWKGLSQSIKKNSLIFQTIALDSIYICGIILSTQQFLKDYYNKVFDSTLISKFKNGAQTKYLKAGIDTSEIYPFVQREIIKYAGQYCQLTVTITTGTNVHYSNTVSFDFIMTNNGYKLFGCNDNTNDCFY